MGNVQASVLHFHRLDIPISPNKLTLITGTATFDSGQESTDTSLQINFKFKVNNIKKVAQPPIGTASLSTPHFFDSVWMTEDFTAIWNPDDKNIYCSVSIRRACTQSCRDGAEGIYFPFEVFIYHIPF
ncbi:MULTISPECIES: hypothetical protein [Bacillus cereus group]|uniref:Uncharacterized protein n=1 Tax=Bacillus thuringiensis serovar toumanoffi TaxID=180862 RepID=A0ABD5I8B4_BACTU|nr:hypothetical protein [Bacillus thuringiensis]MCU5283079.1 hypothetical protein [Bacillus cereus]AMR88545.1 hypothetical protein A3L20_31675 [Bacillus thuringiensis]KIP25870.1 hypothetical protein BG10_5015 [Bacillus thuringiensis serovar morrisoni]MBG9640458.1 hypothetical protein [Bacillus thuringiensis]MBG9676400.1 hypothetical protein [Bacillus thuringiensis]